MEKPNSTPPFQFGISSLLLLTAAVALCCSLGARFGSVGLALALFLNCLAAMLVYGWRWALHPLSRNLDLFVIVMLLLLFMVSLPSVLIGLVQVVQGVATLCCRVLRL